MRVFWKKVWNVILDGLFPAYCLGCRNEGCFLCDVCQKSLSLPGEQTCPLCYGANMDGGVCPGCRNGHDVTNQRFLDGLIAASRFEEHSLLQKAVHTLKYDFVRDLAEPLGKLLADVFLPFAQKNPKEFLIFCPMPLHPKRERWRGFNQSLLLCSFAVEELQRAGIRNVEMREMLQRVHFSRPQMELTRAERLKNIDGAFALKPDACSIPMRVTSGIIVLVDDVATTLSTLESAAKTLKQAGCKRVCGLVLARVF